MLIIRCREPASSIFGLSPNVTQGPVFESQNARPKNEEWTSLHGIFLLFASHDHSGFINARLSKAHARATTQFGGSHGILTGELHKMRAACPTSVTRTVVSEQFESSNTISNEDRA